MKKIIHILSILFLFVSFHSAAKIENQIIVQGALSTCAVVNEVARCWGYKYGDNFLIEGYDFKQVKQIATGMNFGCALMADSMRPVYCWGASYSGSMMPPMKLKTPTTIAAGAYHACVVEDEKAVCWGDNDANQLKIPNGIPPIQSLSAASDYTCALLKNKSVECWGEKGPHTVVPNDLGYVVQISTGWPVVYAPSGHAQSHVCALLQNKKVRCWGDNSYKQLDVPQFQTQVKKVVAGSGFSCALLEDQSVECWGDELSLKSKLTGVLDIVANRSLCVTTQAEVKCFTRDYISPWDVPKKNLTKLVGSDFNYYCGLSDSAIECFGSSPVLPIKKVSRVDKIVFSTYTETGCVFGDGGKSCWGENDDDGFNKMPLDIDKASSVSMWRPGLGCAVIDGHQKCWSIYKVTIGPKQEMSKVKQVFIGSDASCLLFENQRISCYDENNQEMSIPYLENVTDVVINGGYGCAVSNSQLQCWGDEKNVPGLKNYPKLIGVTKIKADSFGFNMCAVAGAKLFCWSMIEEENSEIPQFPELVDVVDVAISTAPIQGTGHLCALLKNGISCWGRNDHGQASVPKEFVSF